MPNSAFGLPDPDNNALPGSGGQPTIPADLVPYLQAADEVEEDDVEHEPVDEELLERAHLIETLKDLSDIFGPDPQILAELDLDDEDEDADDYSADDAGNGAADASYDAAAEEAALQVALAERVEQIYQAIVARAPEHKVQPSLERIRTVMTYLAEPYLMYQVVHITGTNGKTSTARITDALLSELGMRTGRFTSPHLSDVRERITLEGKPISREGFIAAWEDIAPYVDMVDQKSAEEDGPRMSFFEVFTVMALAAFADYPVNTAVIEVGMGGEWDATNIVDSQVSIITPIDLDHTKWLGASVTDIAREKSGIIKPGQITVIARQEYPEVEAILLAKAAQVGALVRLEGRDYEVLHTQVAVGGQLVTIRTPAATYTDVFIPLHGEHQAHNAAAALVAAESLTGGGALNESVVEQGMMHATSPGRMEVVRRSPTIIVDAAHNPHGARSLVSGLERTFGFTRLVGVFSAMGDKDVESVLSEAEPIFDEIVVTPMGGERAMPLDDLVEIATAVFGEERVHRTEDLSEALETAVNRAEGTNDPATSAGVVVFGSVVLVGATRSLLGTN